MSGLLVSLQGAVAQGVLWGIMVLGVYITFRLMDIADMTVDGSFALGACVCAVLVVNKGVNPVLALLVAAAAGVVAGAVTGILHTVFEIRAILAGILTMIALYSINLHVMGKANVSLLRTDTIFRLASRFLDCGSSVAALVVSGGLILVLVLWVYWFFGTELGMCIRATGFNVHMMRAQGVNTDTMTILGLLLSNGLISACGAVVAQNNGFADVGMGIGTLVIGLASIIIGEVVLNATSFKTSLIAVMVGSVIYRVIIAVVLYMGMEPNDLKLFTAVVVVLALSMPLIKTHIAAGREG